MSLGFLAKIFTPKSTIETTKTVQDSLYQKTIDEPKPSWLNMAVEQLRRHEGEVLHAYTDSLGMLTIGVGRLIDKRKGGGISKDESDYLLTNDINSRLADLNAKLPWFNTLNDPRKAVLLNMSFQLGMAGLLNFRNTLNKIQDGDFAGAADNMLKSKWAEQTPKRAQEMANQMRTGKWQSG